MRRIIAATLAGAGALRSEFGITAQSVETLMQSVQDARRKGTDVYFLVELLDKLKIFAHKTNETSELRHELELERLQAAMSLLNMGPAPGPAPGRSAASGPGSALALAQRGASGPAPGPASAPGVQPSRARDMLMLELSMQRNEEARMETEFAVHEMLSFYYTIKAELGAKGHAPSCDYLTCGNNAVCNLKPDGAVCECKRCYTGDGFTCRPTVCTPSKFFTAQSLLNHVQPEWTANVADIDTVVLNKDEIGVVWRDIGDNDRGYMMVGHVGSEVQWGPLGKFNGDFKAYAPSIAAAAPNRLAVVYRDEDKSGAGYMVSVDVNPQDLTCTFGNHLGYSRQQSHQAVVKAMGSGKVLVLFSEERTDAEGKPVEAYGGAALIQTMKGGRAKTMGEYRFAEESLISRIVATNVAQNAIVVGFREVPLGEDEEEIKESNELSAVWMEVKENELVVSPNVLHLEPARKEMWSRSLTLVAENTLAYAYQSGSEEKTKLAILSLDRDLHTLRLAGTPRVIGVGRTPYIKGIDLPTRVSTPRTFNMFQRPSAVGTAKICNVMPNGRQFGCKDVKWANTKVSSVSAERLQDGRLFFAFADVAGVPFFQLIDNMT